MNVAHKGLKKEPEEAWTQSLPTNDMAGYSDLFCNVKSQYMPAPFEFWVMSLKSTDCIMKGARGHAMRHHALKDLITCASVSPIFSCRLSLGIKKQYFLIVFKHSNYVNSSAFRSQKQHHSLCALGLPFHGGKGDLARVYRILFL